MKALLLIFLLVPLPLRGEVGRFSAPVASFVREIFTYEDWNKVEWQSHDETGRNPDGGYLFRFALGFGPGEDPLIFVATDRFGERFTPAWNIYMTTPEGGWRKIATGQVLNHEQFHVDNAGRTIILHYPVRVGEGKNYATLEIGSDGGIRKTRHEYGKTDEATRDRLEAMGIPVTPSIEKIPLSAYLENPAVEWRPFDRTHGVGSQSLDEGDEMLLADNRRMDFSVARELVGKLPDEMSRSTAAAPENLQDDARTTGGGKPLPQDDPSVEGKTPFPIRALAILLMAAAAVLVRMWLKRR